MSSKLQRREPLQKRFEKKIRKDPSGCWFWIGALNGADYGIIAPPGGLGKTAINKHARPLLAHRVSYELYVGSIPTGCYIDHLCRQPSCVNPQHLEPVPPVQNCLRGSRTKWSDTKVSECRRFRTEGRTLFEIQDITGIPHQTVWTYVSGSRRRIPLAGVR